MTAKKIVIRRDGSFVYMGERWKLHRDDSLTPPDFWVEREWDELMVTLEGAYTMREVREFLNESLEKGYRLEDDGMEHTGSKISKERLRRMRRSAIFVTPEEPFIEALDEVERGWAALEKASVEVDRLLQQAEDSIDAHYGTLSASSVLGSLKHVADLLEQACPTED